MLAKVDSTYLTTLFGGLLICSILYYVVQRIRYNYKIHNIGGTRARLLSPNPIVATFWLLKGPRYHSTNRLLEFFNSMIDHGQTASRTHCVELQIQPNQRYFITRDSEHIKTVLTTKFTEYGKGPEFHDLWQPFLGDSIFTTDGSIWHNSRSIIRPMFVKDRISDLHTFERWASAMINKFPAPGITVDLMDLFYRMTLDVTTDFLLGATVNSLDNPQNEFATAFNDVQNIQMIVTMVGPFQAWVPRGHYNRCIQVIDKFVMPYIDQAISLSDDELEKISNSDKDFTFLHSVARYTRDSKVLRDQIVAVLLAGRDTTAATLSWAFYELSHYPEKYQKLRKEIISVVGRDKPPTYDDLKNMTYLRHTLNETLRLYPAVPYNIRAALKDTTLPNSPGQPPVSVVEGDIVLYSTLAMQRRRDIYPPISETFEDPAIFSPERWEHWSPKPWQYVPFNGGPRICVGQNFAMTEMAYCIVRILQKYDRLEYRGVWEAQRHVANIVGQPSDGIHVALYENLT